MKKITKVFRLVLPVVMILTLSFSTTAQAVSNNANANANADKISICHKTGENYQYMETPAGPALTGHLGHGDFYYNGGDIEDKDGWCQDNAGGGGGSAGECANVTNTIVSDTTTLEGGNASVLVPEPYHYLWFSDIGSTDAAWIWGENPVTDPESDSIETFTKTFTIMGVPKDSSLEMGADNSFIVKVNGTQVGFDAAEWNFQATKTYDIPAALLQTGSNTIEFTVKNWAFPDVDPANNPAGLIYALTVNENDCVPPVLCDITNVIVSDEETIESDELPAVLVDPVNSGWVASIGSTLAKWIWGENPLEESLTNKSEIFIREFTIVGVPQNSSLEMAADNYYSVELNGDPIGDNPGEYNYAATVTYPVPASSLNTGTNTIEFTVTNFGQPDTTPLTNPAGLIFALTVNEKGVGNQCPPVEPPTCPPGQHLVGEVCVPNEPPVVIDVCENIDGNQTVPPEGYVQAEGDICNEIEVSVTTDMCLNLPGNQSTVPGGYTKSGANCYSANQCSDGIDNADTEDTLIDQSDPGCWIEEGGGYDPTDNDESNNPILKQCSDNIDNDQDGNTDIADSGCHSDGDATNPGTYVPTDDNETVSQGGGGGSSSNISSGSSRRGNSATPPGQVLGAEDTCGIYVDKYLKAGYDNDEGAVIKVQKFLNDYTKAGLIINGLFDAKTEKALKAFQLAHSDKILVPWGIKAPTGIFYLTTQTEVNNIMCPTLDLPIPTQLVNFSRWVANQLAIAN